MVAVARQLAEKRYRESYGRYFEDFQVGDIYEHPPGSPLAKIFPTARIRSRDEVFGNDWILPGSGPLTGSWVAEIAGRHLGLRRKPTRSNVASRATQTKTE